MKSCVTLCKRFLTLWMMLRFCDDISADGRVRDYMGASVCVNQYVDISFSLLWFSISLFVQNLFNQGPFFLWTLLVNITSMRILKWDIYKIHICHVFVLPFGSHLLQKTTQPVFGNQLMLFGVWKMSLFKTLSHISQSIKFPTRQCKEF